MPGAGNPAAWNRYGYVMYNPVKYTDPSGHYPVSDDIDPSIYYRRHQDRNQNHLETENDNLSGIFQDENVSYIEVKITADNWDNYLRSLEKQLLKMEDKAFWLHLILGVIGATGGAAIGAVVAGPVGAAFGAGAIFLLTEMTAYYFPSGQKDVNMMENAILILDEHFAELEEGEILTLELYHNYGPPVNHPASNGYSIRVNGSVLLEVSDYVGQCLINSLLNVDLK